MNDANKPVTNKAKNQIQSLKSSTDICEWVKKVCEDVVKLEIKTTMTESGDKMILTKINLLEGDITTTIHSENENCRFSQRSNQQGGADHQAKCRNGPIDR